MFAFICLTILHIHLSITFLHSYNVQEMMRLQTGQREPAYEASVRRMLGGGFGGDDGEGEGGDDYSVSVFSGMSRKLRKEIKDRKGGKEVKRPAIVLMDSTVDCNMTESDKTLQSSNPTSRKNKTPLRSIGGMGGLGSLPEETEEPTEVEDVDASSDSDLSSDDSGGDSDDDSEDDDEDDEDGREWVEKKGDGKYRKQLPARDDPTARSAEKDSRKDARKVAKEAAAKKRTEKVPKHVKKRAIKAGKKK